MELSMTDSILTHEGVVLVSFFFVILVAMAVWESLFPRRPLNSLCNPTSITLPFRPPLSLETFLWKS